MNSPILCEGRFMIAILLCRLCWGAGIDVLKSYMEDQKEAALDLALNDEVLAA